MKVLGAIFGFIIKLFAGSFVWLIIAAVASIPLGLFVLKATESFIVVKSIFYKEINGDIRLFYILLVITCFVGILISRIVAVSIKVLADKKLELKNPKS